MATLFDILKSKVWSPEIAENTIFNPIGAKIDGVIMVNDINHHDTMFRVKAIREYSVGDMAFVDYELHPLSVTKPQRESYLLRVMPSGKPESGGVICVMLHNEYSGVFSQDIVDLVNHSSQEAYVFCIGSDEFWRIDEQKEPLIAQVKSVADTNGDGSVDPEEITTSEIKYWDFSRITPVDGVELEELAVVEMNTDSGWINVLRGFGVDLRKIESY